MNSPGVYFEISQTTLRALRGESGLELPLERGSDGRLTQSSRARIVTAVQEFVQSKSWQPRQRAYCAIGARGVTLRRLTVPSVGKEEFQRLLRMQIESEFPLSPEELAWGYQAIGESRQNGTVKQELLVLAVKKEVLEEYSTLLSDCGVTPIFTLAALARSGLSPQPSASYAILDVGQQSSELVLFEHGFPLNVRVLAFAENESASASGLTSFAKALNGSWSGKRLFVAGSPEAFKVVSNCLTEQFTSGVECEALNIVAGPGRSSATLGLRKTIESGAQKLIFFHSQPEHGKAQSVTSAPLKWVGIAGALLIGILLLPYAEAVIMKPRLEKKLVAMKVDEGRLEVINKELGFLQHLKQSQPPYLDALYLLSKSAPQGAKLESLNMNRSGDFSLRGSVRNADQVAELRNKLIASGFFASVSVEEQTPTPDKQKLIIRLTAQWKPLSALQKLSFGPTPEEIEKAKSKKDSPGGMPGSGMPPGFSSGTMPPGIMPAGAMPVSVSPGNLPPGATPAGLPPGVKITPVQSGTKE